MPPPVCRAQTAEGQGLGSGAGLNPVTWYSTRSGWSKRAFELLEAPTVGNTWLTQDSVVPTRLGPNAILLTVDQRKDLIYDRLANIMPSASRSPTPRDHSRSPSRGRSRTRSPRRSVSNLSRSRSPQRSRSRSRSNARSLTRSIARSQSPRRNGRRTYSPDSRSRSRSSRGRGFTRSPSRRSISPAPRSAKVSINSTLTD